MYRNILFRNARRMSMAIAASFSLAAMAVPAKPTPVVYTQPDGTEITVMLRGDERHHFILSTDGYLLVNDNDALYYGNIDADGKIQRSNLLAKPAELRQAADKEYLRTVDMDRVFTSLKAEAQEAPRKYTIARPAAAQQPMRTHGVGLFPGTAYPAYGNAKGLIVLVEYKDKKFNLSDPADYFTRMVHQEGFSDYGATGSARDYFIASSNGIFQPEFDVYGPITLGSNMSYYGGNDWSGNDKNPEKMAIEACQILDNPSAHPNQTTLTESVDFSQYDCDGDGYIDNVYIFYAGQGEATGGSSSTVWPHSWEVTAATSTPYIFDGVRLDHYACSNEWEGSASSGKPDGIGTFCHEFSHVMGLPDLYATSYTSAFTPGAWSVMDYGPYNNDGRTPPLYGLFERNALKYTEPIEITGAMSAELHPISQNAGFVINTPDPNEFFLFENRQQEGWDAYIPSHGMLVWHIDFDDYQWSSNSVNNSSYHQYVDIEEANNNNYEGGRSGDPFPGSGNVTSFTDDTNPSMRTWDNQRLNLPITNIKEVDGIIYFDVCGGGDLVIAGSIPPETIADRKMVALEASDITDSSFVANWEEMEDASAYIISLYEGEIVRPEEIVDFSDGVTNLPEGWYSHSTLSYDAEEKCGEAVPSMRFAIAGSIKSPEFATDILSLSFWARGVLASELNKIAVHAGEETYVFDINNEEGVTYTIDEMPEGVRQISIEYVVNEKKGSLAIDDIHIIRDNEPKFGEECQEFTVEAPAQSFEFTGLKQNTPYAYTIVATDGDLYSESSEQIVAITKILSGIANASAEKCAISVNNGTIRCSEPAQIYSVDGRLIGNAPACVPAGMYIVLPASSPAQKVAVK